MQPRQSLSEQVRAHVVEQLASGELRPGDRVRELPLAHTLGVSQGPVREALRELAALGLVVTEPRRGTRVRDLDDRALHASYPVRAALESLAGALAAPRLAGATDGLRNSLRGMRIAAAEDDLPGLARHSVDFHRQIIDAADNNPLRQAWQALGIEVLTPVSLARADIDLAGAAEEHSPILDALHAGDADAAATLLAAHAADYGLRLDPRPTRSPTDPQELP
ncbi:hypothetical protein GCM10027047_27200 [Rhodococcus aerolatus]